MQLARITGVLRILRIPSSLFFGPLCVLAIVLWVRSYWYAEGGMVSTFPNQHVAFHGGGGRMCVWFEHSPGAQWYAWRTRPLTERVAPDDEDRIPWFDLAFFWPKMTRLYVAHWFLVVLTACIAIVPWIPRTFGTKAMLIGTALFAATIAAITWVDRTF